jgi:hypothetical protein
MKATYQEIEKSQSYPIGVSHSSPYNSTAFTNCCGVAITSSEQCCPKCQLYIIGWDSRPYDRDNIRFNYAHKRSYR